MAAGRPMRRKRYFTAAEANATLPLVRAIVGDITELARQLQERHERLMRVLPEGRAAGEAHREELLHVQQELERDKGRMQDYERELRELGVELKDYRTGLIDFPCWMGEREVCLCWRLGEPELAHWHEVDAGFAGRQKLMVGAERG
jgi:hypothetical protein